VGLAVACLCEARSIEKIAKSSCWFYSVFSAQHVLTFVNLLTGAPKKTDQVKNEQFMKWISGILKSTNCTLEQLLQLTKIAKHWEGWSIHRPAVGTEGPAKNRQSFQQFFSAKQRRFSYFKLHDVRGTASGHA